MVGLRPAMTEPAFDIRANLFAPGSDLDEEAAHTYEQDLAHLFEVSPEGRALAAAGVELGFAGMIVHYLLWYQGLSVPDMTDLAFETVIYDIVPAR